MAMKAALFDGKEIKGVNIPFNLDSDFGWNVWGKQMTQTELYSRVAAAYRAMQINANALSGLPFMLLDKSGNEYDISDNWENKVGFMESPTEILRLWRLSLGMTNSAYGFMQRTRGKMELRYIVPDTIEPLVDDTAGLVGFKRTVNGRPTTYTLKSGIIRHIYRLDFDTELLPSESTEFRALMNAAGILYHADLFAKEHFERGGIKPTMLAIKGVLNPEEMKRVETYWDKFRKGAYKVVGKVFNAEMFSAIPVGDGIADLKDNNVYRQAIENIAMATGIPLSLLLSNSANYATAEVEETRWFNYDVVPYAKFIASELNKNLWSSFDLKMQFLPEQTDPDAEETKSRAETFQTLVNTGTMPVSLAFRIAGLTMPVGEEIDSLDVEPEEPEEPQSEPEVEPEPEPQEDEEEKAIPLTFDQFKELHDWRDVATRKMKRGESVADMGWKLKELPASIGDEVNAKLAAAETIEDVKAAFEIVTQKEDNKGVSKFGTESDEEIKALADALNKLAEKAEPQVINLHTSPVNVTVNEKDVTVTPEIKADAPMVTVNVPEQAAPVVNVTNEVQTPSVTVNNDVQPADVVIERPKSARVRRDINGNIEGIEAE